MGFNVIIDSREQTPWDLTSICSEIDDIIVCKLDTGDYSIEGMEDVLCFERKASVSELASNITTKRFENELVRMSKIKYSFLMLEFNVDDILQYPIGSTVPRKIWSKLKVKSEFIMSSISKIQIKYGINIVFCGDASNAALMAINIMRRLYVR